MRRSLLAGIGALAVLIFAACSPDQPRREPLAPTDAGLAKGGPGGGGGSPLCAGSALTDISKQQKALFSSAVIATDFDPFLTAIKNACPTSPSSLALLTYLQNVITNRGSPTRAAALVKLWKDVTTYAVDPAVEPPLVRLPSVFDPGTPPTENVSFGVRGGGADVLDGAGPVPGPASPLFDLEMFTWDNQAGFQISSGQAPLGPHLITLTPLPCPGTSLRKVGGCYNVESYPAVTTWIPNIDFGQCIRGGGPAAAISHFKEGYGTEVLPPGGNSFPWAGNGVSCVNTHDPLTGWLRREGGPLGSVLAKAVDYLRPRPLFADDAGESGQAPSDSPFGGVLQVIFEDDFNEINNPPDVGDAWVVDTAFPGYIQIQNNVVPGMPGNSVVLSQAQGNCSGCPVFRLLGSRENFDTPETIGSYEVTWTSAQTKSQIKEAPFVVLNSDSVEIARVTYLTVSSSNILRFSFLSDTGMYTVDFGSWSEDIPHSFKVTVNLNTGSLATSNTIAFAFGLTGGPLSSVTLANPKAENATSLGLIGYVLTGIDAGIMASNGWRIIRLADPQ